MKLEIEIDGYGAGESKAVADAIRGRIKAALNAAHGVSTDELDKMGDGGINRLRESLQDVLAWNGCLHSPPPESWSPQGKRVINAARAALKKGGG